MTSQPDPRGIYPRSVTPGIETQPFEPVLPDPGVYIGLDWIRCTGPDSLLERLRDLLSDQFGDDPKPWKGAIWFKHGLVWEPGAAVSWGHKSSICQVDLRGERLKLMDGQRRVDLLGQLLSLGMNATRIDGALDFVGQDIGLCLDAKASCERKELCIMRGYNPDDAFTSDGFPKKRLLKLGARDSAVCARIYDKGLEQDVAPPGHWERLEVEWKEDRAAQLAILLGYAGVEWPTVLRSHIFGAMDFREHNGRSELERRPRAAWWASLLAGLGTARIGVCRKNRSFERWAEALRTSYGRRLLELAATAKAPLSDVIAWLLAGLEPSTDGGAVVMEFVRAYQCHGDK